MRSQTTHDAQFFFLKWRLARPRDTNFSSRSFRIPVAAISLSRRSSCAAACKSQLIFRLHECAPSRFVLPTAINQATEFQFGATSRGHAENSHYETHVVNQWNRFAPVSQVEKRFGLCTSSRCVFNTTWWMCIYFTPLDDFRGRVKRSR